MKVSAVSTFNGNPYLAVYWKRLYEKYWKDEVDELWVCIHGDNKSVNHFIHGLFKNSKITAIPLPEMGAALDYIYPYLKGDVLVTVDSDNFITEKFVISRNVLLLKEYAAVGIFGGSAKPFSVSDDLQKHFGIVRLNSFLSFWDKKKIDEEPFTFQRMKFAKGEEFLGYKFKEWGFIDTMGYLTLTLKQKYNILPLKYIQGSQHIGGLSHKPLGENRKEIMNQIIKETIDEVPEDIR